MFDAGCIMHNDHHHHHHAVATILYHTSLQPWHRPWRSTHGNSPALEALDVKDTLDRHSGWRQRWKEKGHAFQGGGKEYRESIFWFSLQSSFYKANIFSHVAIYLYILYASLIFFVTIRNVYDILVQLFSTRFFNVTGDSISRDLKSGLIYKWPPFGLKTNAGIISSRSMMLCHIKTFTQVRIGNHSSQGSRVKQNQNGQPSVKPPSFTSGIYISKNEKPFLQASLSHSIHV